MGTAACALVLGAAVGASASRLQIRNDFGPENAERPVRPETRYIVLHTTEGREAGSLRKLRTRGEAHYFVHRDGRVVRLIDRRRVATHAGLSMWAGQQDLDESSLGIEVSGYHDKEPTPAQYAAVRELLRQLQSLYSIPDDHVLTHSMVAYGAPNRFHPHPHRGRKRCAMVFADPDVRRRLGLTETPGKDPDVAAGELRVGDPALQRHLYPPRAATPVRAARTEPRPGAPAHNPARVVVSNTITPERTAWKIAGPRYASASTVYVFPDGTRVRGDAMRQWDEIPLGTRVLLEETAGDQSAVRATEVADRTPRPEGGLMLVGEPAAARDLLGDVATADTTTYLFPAGSVGTGAELAADPDGRARLERLPSGTRILVGYVPAGRVAPGQILTRVAGSRWDNPSTYYRIPGGGIRTGVEIDDSRVPAGTLVFFRR